MTQNFARKEYIQRFMTEFALKPQIASYYWEKIADVIIDDVVKDVNECADPQDWDEDDVRLAVGRVILERLDIEQ